MARVAENPPANAGAAGDPGLTPWLGGSSGGGNGNPLQCSCLWRIPGTEEPSELRPRDAESDMTAATEHTHVGESFRKPNTDKGSF